MELNLLLWGVGILFTLGVFALKMGLGLGYGNFSKRAIFQVLILYFLLFLGMSYLLHYLFNPLILLLQKGPYLHALMALAMFLWGLFLLKGGKHRACEGKSQAPQKEALLLVFPCPVCLTAIAFSLFITERAFKLPPLTLTLFLYLSFLFLTLSFLALTKLKSTFSSEINLGLSMMVIGAYYLLALTLPAKIEEAKSVYRSFLTEGEKIPLENLPQALVILGIAFLAGFLIRKRRLKA